MNILFVIAVLFGCYSAEAIDDVISIGFDETEMSERIEDGTCFYEWHEDVAIDSEYKRFMWADGDVMVVLHGKTPDGRSIYFWGPLEKYKSLYHSKVFNKV